MKLLLTLNFLISLGLGYFVYENRKEVKEPNPQIFIIEDKVSDFKKEIDENKKLLHDLKARMEKLDKNVNGHKIGDSLRDHIGGLQSDLEALEKKLK